MSSGLEQEPDDAPADLARYTVKLEE